MKRSDSLQLWVEPEVHASRVSVPGNIRQRIKRMINDLADNPRPANSKALNVEGLELPPDVELRRIRIEKWRILYAVDDKDGWVWILRIRQRPPYQYEDLVEIAGKIS